MPRTIGGPCLASFGRVRRGRAGPPGNHMDPENLAPMRPTYQVTELLGDGIGPELSRAIHTLAEALPIRLDFLAVDLSLENRRARRSTIYDEAVEAIKATVVAL